MISLSLDYITSVHGFSTDVKSFDGGITACLCLDLIPFARPDWAVSTLRLWYGSANLRTPIQPKSKWRLQD